MELTAVPKSSNIAEQGYDVDSFLLYLRFKDKDGTVSPKIAEYSNFPPEMYAEMMEAESMGSFFYRNVRPFKEKFPFRYLDSLPEPPTAEQSTDFTDDGTPLPVTPAGEALLAEVLKSDDPEQLKQEALALSEKTKAIVIASPEAYELAATTLLAIAGMRAALETTFRPDIAEKHKVWKAALAVLNHYDAPLESDDKRLREGMSAFKKQQDAQRLKDEQAERDRLQAEADAEAKTQAQELQIADAIDAEQRGEPELAKVILNSAPLPMQARYVGPVTFASTTPKTKGITHVEDWHFEIVDAKQIPRKYLIVDEKAIKQEATTLKERAEIPGVRFWDRGGMRVSPKSRKQA
jgi:hypothetical protein